MVTETYIILGAYDTEQDARNCFSYVVTRFFRFLIAVRSSAKSPVVFSSLYRATALEAQRTLITNNLAHFQRVPNLVIETWKR